MNLKIVVALVVALLSSVSYAADGRSHLPADLSKNYKFTLQASEKYLKAKKGLSSHRDGKKGAEKDRARGQLEEALVRLLAEIETYEPTFSSDKAFAAIKRQAFAWRALLDKSARRTDAAGAKRAKEERDGSKKAARRERKAQQQRGAAGGGGAGKS